MDIIDIFDVNHDFVDDKAFYCFTGIPDKVSLDNLPPDDLNMYAYKSKVVAGIMLRYFTEDEDTEVEVSWKTAIKNVEDISKEEKLNFENGDRDDLIFVVERKEYYHVLWDHRSGRCLVGTIKKEHISEEEIIKCLYNSYDLADYSSDSDTLDKDELIYILKDVKGKEVKF